MGRKRIIGKVELIFTKENNDDGVIIDLKGICRDKKYINNIKNVYECISKALNKTTLSNKGKKNEQE